MYASSDFFFSTIATALNKLRDCIYVEIQLGDATKLLEDMCSGLVKERDLTWPIEYDYVHMSNIL